jgi:hypothetical protein
MHHAQFVMGALELPLPICAQSKRGVAAADSVLPEVGKRCAGTVKIADKSRCHFDRNVGATRSAPNAIRDPPGVMHNEQKR